MIKGIDGVLYLPSNILSTLGLETWYLYYTMLTLAPLDNFRETKQALLAVKENFIGLFLTNGSF